MPRQINSEVQKIIDKYEYDQSIRKHANKYYFHENRYYSDIRSKEDVKRAESFVKGTIDNYRRVNPLYNSDIEEMEKALGRYEDAVKKVLSCYSSDRFDFDYSAEELLGLINKIFEFEEQIVKINTRMLWQD